MIERLLGLASVLSFAVGTTAAPAPPPSEVVFRFADPAIVESSGLVVQDGLYLTVNDSGDTGRVFAVDGDGRTVGVTSWGDATDVEALAPAGDGEVWVGDIGDNSASRSSVQVLRVPVGRGDRTVSPTAYDLVYPGGPHDAETLLAAPSGRLYVVSKEVFGARIYAAPRQLSADSPNRLRAVADSFAFATDGSFLPDGRHYLVRGYGSATLYTYPGFARVGSFDLPDQQQGEGIAVGPDDTVYLSSEGLHSAVRSMSLPGRLQRLVAAASPTPSPSEDWLPDPQPGASSGAVWFAGGLLIVGLVVVGGLLLTVFVVVAVWLLLRRGSSS